MQASDQVFLSSDGRSWTARITVEGCSSEAEALALPRAAGDGVYIVVPYLLGLVVDAGAPRGADIALAGVAGVLGAVAVFVALPSRDEEKIG